jgi:TPR repeat protein
MRKTRSRGSDAAIGLVLVINEIDRKEQQDTMNNSIIGKIDLKALWVCVALGIVFASGAVAGPEQDNEQAETEFARGDLMASMALWRKAALEGYAPAQARMGDILDKSEEDKEAVEWYRKAAAQGNAAGEFGLGQMYLKGEGVEKDVEMAHTYIRLAAEKNQLLAVVMMMNAYRTGALGLTPDSDKADQWEAKVAELSPGYVPAQGKNTEKEKKAGSN